MFLDLVFDMGGLSCTYRIPKIIIYNISKHPDRLKLPNQLDKAPVKPVN